MSAIAKILLEQGHQVSGSDLHLSEITRKLEMLGATIYAGHRAENVEGATEVVVSSAIPPTNGELIAARERGIPVMQRAEMLARLMKNKRGIAVAGTHGKTTTTSMVALMLERNGLDPTVLIGGELNDFGGNAKLGRGQYVVAEADESDGSFLKLAPYYAVVTNVEPDHLDYYGTLDRIALAFERFLDQVAEAGLAVLGVDDPVVGELSVRYSRRYLSYALKAKAHYTARDIHLQQLGSSCRVFFQGRELGQLRLQVPGVHNISNALAAVALGREIGLEFEPLASALATFRGVQRRFETLALVNGIRVVDDYGHHPTEVQATLKAARNAASGRVICIFQPHRYTRTKYLYGAFGQAFGLADELIITDIYPAGEPPIEGVSAGLIVDAVERYQGKRPLYLRDREEILRLVMEMARPGDLVLTLGAGDIRSVGEALAEKYRRAASCEPRTAGSWEEEDNGAITNSRPTA